MWVRIVSWQVEFGSPERQTRTRRARAAPRRPVGSRSPLSCSVAASQAAFSNRPTVHCAAAQHQQQACRRQQATHAQRQQGRQGHCWRAPNSAQQVLASSPQMCDSGEAKAVRMSDTKPRSVSSMTILSSASAASGDSGLLAQLVSVKAGIECAGARGRRDGRALRMLPTVHHPLPLP